MGDFNRSKEISDHTKKSVLARQGNRSISNAYLNENSASFHHFVPRSSSGVGYEWNIVALTFDEHRAIHDHQPIKVNGRERYSYDEFQTLIRNHLILHYRNWSEKNCKYQKHKTEEEYQVERIK